MFFHWRQHAQVTLYSSGVVITDVALNHLHEFLFAGEALAVIAFPLQNAPESFHRPIVNAVGYTGHTLCHSSLYEFVVERSACVLEASITVEQGMGIRVRLNSFVKGFANKWIIIVLTEHIGHDTPVTEIQNGTQIEFMYLNTLIPFEFCHIGKPFLIRLLCVELAVQQVFSKILGTLCPSGAATVIVLYSGADIFDPADAQHPFIIDIDAIIMTEIVIQSPVTFIRVFQMNLFNLVGQFLILRSPVAQLPGCPFVVSRTGYMEKVTGCLNSKPLFFVTLSNGYISMSLSYF